MRDLAELVATPHRCRDRLPARTPARRPPENELIVTNDRFLALGLEPTTLSEGLLEETLEIGAKYASPCRRDQDHRPVGVDGRHGDVSRPDDRGTGHHRHRLTATPADAAAAAAGRIPSPGSARRSRPVGAPGFEPRTSCSQSRRATNLRHAPSPAGTRAGGRLPPAYGIGPPVPTTGRGHGIASAPMPTVRVAVFDLGSSSFHLMVVDASRDGRLDPVLRRRSFLHLGTEVARTGRRARRPVGAGGPHRQAAARAPPRTPGPTWWLRHGHRRPARRRQRRAAPRPDGADPGQPDHPADAARRRPGCASSASGPASGWVTRPVLGLDLGGGSLEAGIGTVDAVDCGGQRGPRARPASGASSTRGTA